MTEKEKPLLVCQINPFEGAEMPTSTSPRPFVVASRPPTWTWTLTSNLADDHSVGASHPSRSTWTWTWTCPSDRRFDV
jgi:hypothetical protein